MTEFEVFSRISENIMGGIGLGIIYAIILRIVKGRNHTKII